MKRIFVFLLMLMACAGSAYALEEEKGTGALPENSTCEYRILVTNEAGNPLPDAVVQICDGQICLLKTTDEDGLVIHVGAPFEYEIHVLTPPEGYGYAPKAYLMPQQGGELTITLPGA